MKEVYNNFRRIFAWLLGVTFTVSGILKLMDPVGAGLVMDEYFKFLHLGFLGFISKPAGVAFALVESVTGAALMTGVMRRLAAKVTMLLMAFFTFLTILLVIFNPAMDCGCFGEIIHLTHWQSFFKNLVLDALCLIAFVPWSDLGKPHKVKFGTFVIVSLSMIAFMVYSLMYLPLRDYTNYKPGSILLSAMDESEAAEFTAEFVYEKDGETCTFTLDELPDSTWTFVSSEIVPNKELSKIPVLGITRKGEVCDSLTAEGSVLVVSVYNARRFNEKKKEEARQFLADAEAAGFRAILLSIEPDEDAGEYQSDYRALIGLNRSNGGVTMIHDGEIIKKWSRIQAPDAGELAELMENEPLETMIAHDSRGAVLFQVYLLYIFALFLLL